MRATRRETRTRAPVFATLSAVLLLLSIAGTGAEPYSNVASIFDLGMGARPLAMGGAFVGLADDGNSLFYNPAGLAWVQGLSVLSSCEARSGTANYGHVSAAVPHFGFGVHYFDFGEVSETDEFGNVLGTFSYRSYGLIAAAGMKASKFPFLARIPSAESFGFGLKAKFLRVSTLEPGSGSGFAIDLPFLFRSESPSPRVSSITGYGFGIVIENLVGLPIKYESGHQENWPSKVNMGMWLQFLNQVNLAMDLTSEKSLRLGIEWSPIPAMSLRAGLKYESIWIGSLGMGMRFRNLVFDLAMVSHPYLNSQFRGSLTMTW